MLSSDISVVIPAYNAADFIVDALESISRQSCLPGEVVIINDGSSDQTYQIIQEWIKKADLTYPVNIYNQRNRGISVTRNIGIGHATGKWIAFLDADDTWEPTHLKALVAAIEVKPSAIAAYGAGRLLVGEVVNDVLYDDFWDNPSRRFGKKIDLSEYLLIDDSIFSRLLKGNFIKPSSLMFSRSSATEVGLFNEGLGTGEDREFLLRLIRKGEFVYCPLPITKYRWHDDNATQTKNGKRNSENGLRVLKLIRENNSLRLSDDESAACRQEIKVAVNGYLYVCSREGWGQYSKGLRFVRQMFGLSRALMALDPKHMARCLMP